MKMIAFVVSSVAIFALGFELGGIFVRDRIKERVIKSIPTVANQFAEVYAKISTGEITQDEAAEQMQEMLKFLEIVIE